jgi:hypothetical protein
MKPLPCPFCASPNCELLVLGRACVRCEVCEACGPCSPKKTVRGTVKESDRSRAVELWNYRPVIMEAL